MKLDEILKRLSKEDEVELFSLLSGKLITDYPTISMKNSRWYKRNSKLFKGFRATEKHTKTLPKPTCPNPECVESIVHTHTKSKNGKSRFKCVTCGMTWTAKV